jgi:hypothetical protein
LSVWGRAELGTAATEQLGIGLELDVNFESDNDSVGAFDHDGLV